jgi:hypothetical protein
MEAPMPVSADNANGTVTKAESACGIVIALMAFGVVANVCAEIVKLPLMP